jgi:hypothetical protein
MQQGNDAAAAEQRERLFRLLYNQAVTRFGRKDWDACQRLAKAAHFFSGDSLKPKVARMLAMACLAGHDFDRRVADQLLQVDTDGWVEPCTDRAADGCTDSDVSPM